MTPTYKPLFDEKKLAARISDIGAQITRDYQNKELVIVGVLKGSFIFLADLVRQIKVPMCIEFMGTSSYAGTQSTGAVRISLDLSAEIRGKDVLLVEDIIDTGMTVDYLVKMLQARGPRSIKICTLLSKPEAHQIKRDIDYVGFNISREFVIGYGLDLDGAFRELPYIAQVQAAHNTAP